MTENEHKLVVFMLAQQNIRLKALLEILESRGILEENDFDAFEHLAREEMGDEMMLATMNQYREYARILGLQESVPKTNVF
ncbi:MAG: hypothetical protein WAK26_13615 [Terracidiphilus sp.]